MNEYWNWKLFGSLLIYYFAVFLFFVFAQVLNILFYVVFSVGFAAVCTFINSRGVENDINDLYYSIGDAMFHFTRKQNDV